MNVLAISITFIPSVLLCGHCQLEYLQKNGEINYRFVPEHFINPADVEWADVLVFVRSDSDLGAYVSKIAKKLGKRLVYVLDDDLLNPPSYISSYPYYSLPSTKNNMKTIMKNCEVFLTPSPVLLEKYGDAFNRKYLIAEPSLNRIETKPKNNKIKIGFAGSIDRAQDINEILEDTIAKLVEKYGNKIDIEFMGAKPSFVDKFHLTHLPYQDGYEAYTAFMAKCNWDIGLAPMPDSEFHRCKYFNKFVEYASFGIVGIYSNLEPYIYGIKDRVNGLLVDNTTESWFNAICELIENERLRQNISNECLKQAKDIYSLEVNSRDFLDKVLDGYNVEKHKRVGSFIPAKSLFFVKRVYRKIKEQGTNFPQWLKEKLEKKSQENKMLKELSNNTEILKNKLLDKKILFIISAVPKNIQDEYDKRVLEFEKQFIDEYYITYVNGEDRMVEQINTQFIDENHAFLTFNSYDLNQMSEMIRLFEKSGNVVVNGVNSFISERLSAEMFNIFDNENIRVHWDCHGAIPEKYHSNLNYHAETITNMIEREFYEKADYLYVDSEKMKTHFVKKYYQRDGIIVYPTEK